MRKTFCIICYLIALIACKKDEERPKSCFDYSPKNDLKVGDTVSFSNCSINSSSFLWDFGDGNKSNDKEPKHSYESSGSFQVKLLTSNIELTDSFTTDILIKPKPDDIIYDTINPNLKIFSVRGESPSANCFIPIPKDTSSSIGIDVNNDLINEFTITARHNYTGNQCGRCSEGYAFEIIIEGSFICTQNGNPMLTQYLNFSDTISNNLNWSSSSRLEIYGCNLPWVNYVQNKYIGVKVNDSFGWLRVESYSANGILIKEYGFNRTKGNPIKAGQKA